MKLPPEDVEIFYEIQPALYSFVNQRRRLFPELTTPDDIKANADMEHFLAFREALYRDRGLFDKFAVANPGNLPAGHLEIARSWRHFVAGELYIFRYLKKHTIFLDDHDPPKAYGVLGLNSDIEEIVYMKPPILVKAVLLPFREHIVFDGILQPYNVYFGGGIKRRLNEDYRMAKERFGIITSLPFEPEMDSETVEASYDRVLTAFRRYLGRYDLRRETVDRHERNVRRFAETYLARRDPPLPLHDVTVADVTRYFAGNLPPDVKPKASRTSLKRFFRFMRDTGRMPYYDADDIVRAI
ncbi:MAG: hypothetical protein ACE5HA_15430 [Anaerolineae bacterium]